MKVNQTQEEIHPKGVNHDFKETHWFEVFQAYKETHILKARRISQVAQMQRVSRQKKENRKLEAHLMNRVALAKLVSHQ